MRIGPALAMACVTLVTATSVLAADDVAVQRIKAAFLYKFASYVEWPADAFAAEGSPIVIGVVDAKGIADELRTAVAGRQVGGRTVEVRLLEKIEGPDSCCQILFVGGLNGRGRVAETMAQVTGQPVLTVTEARAGLPKGSVINFLDSPDRVRFDISRVAADRNNLRLRAQLLAVARDVVSQ